MYREDAREEFSKSNVHGTRDTYPVRVATLIKVCGLYSVAV